jgi:hypothetical protein
MNRDRGASRLHPSHTSGRTGPYRAVRRYQEGGAERNRCASWLATNHPGRSWQDPKLQTEFLIWNLKNHYPKVWTALQDPKLSAGQKAMIFQKDYLRPKYTHGGDYATAEAWMSHLPATGPKAPWGSGATAVPFVMPHPGLITLAGSGNVSHNNTTSQTSVNNLIVYSDTDNPTALANATQAALLRRNQNVNQANGGPN